MQQIIEFLREYPLFTISAVILNLIMASMITTKLMASINSKVQDAKSGRGEEKSNYKKYMELARESLEAYERKNNKAKLFKMAIEKTKQAGYYTEYSPMIYLILITIIPVLTFITVYIITFPDFRGALVLAMYIPTVVELTLRAKKKAIIMEFQMNSYKLYKYLHNQISAGVQVSDAIKSLYEVSGSKKLRLILIKLAGAYGRTLDIDYALEEFMTYFNIPEAQTLAVALKQGIDTGDNQGILQRQEEVMFNKYVDYVQAETDACRTRSTMAVLFFVAIIVIMVCVPMFNDMVAGVTKIFIN